MLPPAPYTRCLACASRARPGPLNRALSSSHARDGAQSGRTAAQAAPGLRSRARVSRCKETGSALLSAYARTFPAPAPRIPFRWQRAPGDFLHAWPSPLQEGRLHAEPPRGRTYGVFQRCAWSNPPAAPQPSWHLADPLVGGSPEAAAKSLRPIPPCACKPRLVTSLRRSSSPPRPPPELFSHPGLPPQCLLLLSWL